MFESYFEQAFVYLAYVLSLAGALQLIINQFKPIVFEPIKEWLEESHYLVFVYVVRGVITVLAFHFVWGGTEVLYGLAPALSIFPEFGASVLTVALIVLGEEVIHGIVDRLYEIKEIVEVIEDNINPENRG
jgi:hypothetical protein